MEWLNLHVSILDSQEYIGAEPVERATWLSLIRYCAGQENSGVIVGCGLWTDRKWQQLCRITYDEVHTESQLWEWWDTGNSIRVWRYPLDAQDTCQRLRSQSKRANEAKRQKQLENKNGLKPPKPRKKPKQKGYPTLPPHEPLQLMEPHPADLEYYP